MLCTCLYITGSRIPKDGSKSITETVKSSKVALIFIGILTSIGFIGAIGILMFNITFRKNRYIIMFRDSTFYII